MRLLCEHGEKQLHVLFDTCLPQSVAAIEGGQKSKTRSNGAVQ